MPAKFAVLHCLQGCLAKVVSLKLITDKQMTLVSTATLNLEPFRALHTLVVSYLCVRVHRLHTLASGEPSVCVCP